MKKVILAKRHTDEYLMHKYWSRKPSNILNYYIRNLTVEGDLIIDPFCGSGVFINEGAILNRKVIGIDLNPIAILITKVLTTNVNIKYFREVAEKLLKDLDEYSAKLFNPKIRYVVHEIVVKCEACNSLVDYKSSNINGKKICPFCGQKLNFNIEKMYTTKVVGIKYFDGKFEENEEILARETEYSNYKIKYSGNYSNLFCENRRILAFEGKETKDLFTNRNFSILSKFADEIYKIQEESIRNVLLILLTSSTAQCSRLIAYRNAMSTGGPSWSVPGFWIPPRHLEMNPSHYIRTRLNKIIKGLEQINKKNINESSHKLYLEDNNIVLEKLIEEDSKAKLIFFDPPYGDNIPYLEFSHMWNSFLKQEVDINKDISVSDRNENNSKWNNYSDDLYNILNKCGKVLENDGKLLITFNNNDEKAWASLLHGLQKNGFVSKFVTYQIPAVISSKAQMARNGSYISDIYSIYIKNDEYEYSKDIGVIKDELIKLSSVRNNKINKNFANRTVFLSIIENNIDVSLLKDSLDLLNKLFIEKDNILELKNEYILKDSMSLNKIVISKAKEILKEYGSMHWNDLYVYLAEELLEYGLLEPEEIVIMLKDSITIDNKKKCTLKQIKQLNMF